MQNQFGSDIKIIIIGNCNSGKTSLLNRYIYNKFSPYYLETIALEFSPMIIEKNNLIHRVQFWDLSGQDRSLEVSNLFCKNADGIMILCEAKNYQSLEDTKKWKEKLTDKGIYDNENITMVLIENKSDLYEEGNEENEIELRDFAKSEGYANAFRTSAKSGYGVKEAFEFLFDRILGKLTEKVLIEENSSFMSNRYTNASENEINFSICKEEEIKENIKATSCCM